MAGGDCPRGGNHNWVNTSETATQVTHKCSKCGQTYTRTRLALADALRQLWPALRPARRSVGRAYAVALLVMVALCVAATIWAGGAA